MTHWSKCLHFREDRLGKLHNIRRKLLVCAGFPICKIWASVHIQILPRLSSLKSAAATWVVIATAWVVSSSCPSSHGTAAALPAFVLAIQGVAHRWQVRLLQQNLTSIIALWVPNKRDGTDNEQHECGVKRRQLVFKENRVTEPNAVTANIKKGFEYYRPVFIIATKHFNSHHR